MMQSFELQELPDAFDGLEGVTQFHARIVGMPALT